jgi:hypothetical protein
MAVFSFEVLACGSISLPSFEGARNRTPETFIESSHYRDDDEILGGFLNDDDYALMVEDVERQDAEFDWAWVKVPEGVQVTKPTTLAFELPKGTRIRLDPVVNASLKVAPGIEDEVRGSFTQAFELLDLEVVDGGDAEFEFGVAIVDYKADGTYIYFATVDPFIELEGRLTDLRSGERVLVFRTQEHGQTPALAAADVASGLVKFLR